MSQGRFAKGQFSVRLKFRVGIIRCYPVHHPWTISQYFAAVSQVHQASHSVVLSLDATPGRSAFCDPFLTCPACFFLIAGTLRHKSSPAIYSQSQRIVCAVGFHDSLVPVTLTFTGLPSFGGSFEFVISSEDTRSCDDSPLPHADRPLLEIEISPAPSPPPSPPLPAQHLPSPTTPPHPPPSPTPWPLPSPLPPPSGSPYSPGLAPSHPNPPPSNPLPQGFIHASTISQLRALVESHSAREVIRVQLGGGVFELDGHPLKIGGGNVTIVGNPNGEASVLDAQGHSMLLSVQGVGLELRNLTIANSRGGELSRASAWLSGCEIWNTTGRVFSVYESSLVLSDCFITHVHAASAASVVSRRSLWWVVVVRAWWMGLWADAVPGGSRVA